jgi:hypothetical protein
VQLPAALGLQALFWQLPPLAQTRPHWPQLVFEVASVTQVLLHSALLVSLQRQVEPPQVASEGQVLVPAQTRLLQTSFAVQLLPSLQEPVLFTCLHAPAAQLSVVHGSRSSQSAAPVQAVHMPVAALHTPPAVQLSVPRQMPPLHAS